MQRSAGLLERLGGDTLSTHIAECTVVTLGFGRSRELVRVLHDYAGERRFTMPTKTKKSAKRGKKLSKAKTLKEVRPLLNPQPLPPRHVPIT